MKYYEMHELAYKNLSNKGKLSWDGADSLDAMLDHQINRKLIEKIYDYIGKGCSIVDFGCGTGTVSLFLAREGFEVVGIDISSKAIEMAKANRDALSLNAEFRVADLTTMNRFEADLTIDSSLLHCLVDEKDRAQFFNTCSDLVFIHTMIQSKDMSKLLEKKHLVFKDSILWSTGPESWDMDWEKIDERPMFKHRRISTQEYFENEVKGYGFEILDFEVKENRGEPSVWIGWIKRLSNQCT